MALSPKERERIIEEETLRFETRKNLHHQACASRPRRWPWVVAGVILVWFLYCRIFCGYGHGFGFGSCHSRMGMGHGKSCHGMMWEKNDGVAPGQPVAPKAPSK